MASAKRGGVRACDGPEVATACLAHIPDAVLPLTVVGRPGLQFARLHAAPQKFFTIFFKRPGAGAKVCTRLTKASSRVHVRIIFHGRVCEKKGGRNVTVSRASEQS